MKVLYNILPILNLFLCFACSTSPKQIKSLKVVTHEQFEKFTEETHYITDAEKFGWSIVQQDVYSFVTVSGANWRRPNGINEPSSGKLPVTQVSFNDAMAYCQWSNSRLPTYKEYWKLIVGDNGKVISDGSESIVEVNQANILGNVWEITSSTVGDSVRLAGGSLFCSKETCHGTSKNRKLFVDKQTGNIHIGFAVVSK